MRFKEFLKESEELHNFIHHAAEEELIACKVVKIQIKGNKLTIIADCNDKPRKAGLQSDLTDKLNNRLAKHANLKGLKVQVQHRDTVTNFFDTTPDRTGVSHPLNVIAK